ncbi:NAD(P)-dependent oxidoreductase [Saccharothrix algeriensis]|uniref:3-hydroxyisobutyrate dehydrogenase-like beta-hydroxyacid dehydrogenase n=1 Tax=Saccharothrix algeriensis TaxID=173560 RepID=A0A8T8I3X1_9PSEU|nr:NAD(P)-binding domain-containing protein [Saccharothrix algeriensis]MBM7811670.1 3-hydroxyisobutyrate dehydrogenase-like beta-hydroxyacid dehydrogenase [Saccharothrix algeriensis]QTR05449.1 NAD(P)-dependent oxidoreductase [Saccharothrix algeriensis]
MSGGNGVRVSVLGLGAMGTALATALVEAGHTTAVWNRTAGRAEGLVALGATAVGTAGEAVAAGDVVVACLLDAASVHEVLDPVVDRLAGRVLVNVTTTSPEQSREIAAWAAGHGVAHLDGGIMAVPSMIGEPGSSVLYSGSAAVFEQHRPLLDLWGESAYLGEDAGVASLYDLALLSAMYVMFAGFAHGAAMVAGAGVTAGEFAGRAASWLTAMTGELAGFAEVIDGGDYTVAGQQSLEFSDLRDIIDAGAAQGISTEVVDAVQTLIRRQVDAGHGKEGFARIIESIKHPR